MRRSASERSCRPGRGEASLTSRFPAHGDDTAISVPADTLPNRRNPLTPSLSPAEVGCFRLRPLLNWPNSGTPEFGGRGSRQPFARCLLSADGLAGRLLLPLPRGERDGVRGFGPHGTSLFNEAAALPRMRWQSPARSCRLLWRRRSRWSSVLGASA